jgi:hypothetical protein
MVFLIYFHFYISCAARAQCSRSARRSRCARAQRPENLQGS